MEFNTNRKLDSIMNFRDKMAINIIGVGGVGSNLAIALMHLFRNNAVYTLWDNDNVDAKFLKRNFFINQFYGDLALNMNKAIIVKDFAVATLGIQEIYVERSLFGEEDSLYYTKNRTLAFICVDNIYSRINIEKRIRELYGNNVTIYHIGFDNHRLSIFNTVDDIIPVKSEEELKQWEIEHGTSYQTMPTDYELLTATYLVLQHLFGIVEIDLE